LTRKSHFLSENQGTTASHGNREALKTNASQIETESHGTSASHRSFESHIGHASRPCNEIHKNYASHTNSETQVSVVSHNGFESHCAYASREDSDPPEPSAGNNGSTPTIRFLIEQYYDIQKLRVATFNRIVAYCKAKDSQPRPETHLVSASHTEVETHETDADQSEGGSEKERADGKYRDEAWDLVESELDDLPREVRDLIWYFKSLYSTEKSLAKRLDIWSRDHPLRMEYLSTIRGIGPILSSGLIAWLSPISRFENISKLWKYCGLAPGQKRTSGEKTNYNPKLKTFMWKIASSFEKQKPEASKYRKIYDEKKAYYMSRPDLRADIESGRKGAKLHVRLMAMRYTVKRFLADLWVVWRTMEGLSVTKPYAIDILGHSGYEPPLSARKEAK
jgi:hypothetical protein